MGKACGEELALQPEILSSNLSTMPHLPALAAQGEWLSAVEIETPSPAPLER